MGETLLNAELNAFISFFRKPESMVRKPSPSGSFWYKPYVFCNLCVFIVIPNVEKFLMALKVLQESTNSKK